MALEIKHKVVTSFQQNMRLVYCSDTHDGILIDPACESDDILRMVKENEVTLQGIWLTHSHPDHCGGVQDLKQLLNVPLYAHAEGRFLRENVEKFIMMFAVNDIYLKNCPEPDMVINDGDKLKIGNYEFVVLHTPGHSPDAVCFYSASEKIVFTGDTLFAGGVGRTDLPGGSPEVLKNSLKKLANLPSETKVYTGHGSDSMIKDELMFNPYLQIGNI